MNFSLSSQNVLLATLRKESEPGKAAEKHTARGLLVPAHIASGAKKECFLRDRAQGDARKRHVQHSLLLLDILRLGVREVENHAVKHPRALHSFY